MIWMLTTKKIVIKFGNDSGDIRVTGYSVISHIISKLVHVTYLSYSVTIVVVHKSDNA